MQGHQIRTLCDVGFPIDALIPANATVPVPTRGPHDQWATDHVHVDCPCPDTGRVPLRGTPLEPHTDYTACPGTSGDALARLAVLHDIADHHANAMRLLSLRVDTAAQLLHPASVEHLEKVGGALFKALTLQTSLVEDLRCELTPGPFDPLTLQLVEDYFAQRERTLSQMREQFASWWWPRAR